MGAIESERKSASSEAGAGAERYGLHAGVLGPVETLAQSVSAMAPSTSASLTIPLVFALAGNATWFVYFLALAATLMAVPALTLAADLAAETTVWAVAILAFRVSSRPDAVVWAV